MASRTIYGDAMVRAEPIDSFRLEQIALRALEDPSFLTPIEIRTMAVSILAHIEQYPSDKNYLHYTDSHLLRGKDAI